MTDMWHNSAAAHRLPQAMGIVWVYWRAGGWLMVPLAMVCFLILWHYLRLLQQLRSALRAPEAVVNELENRLRTAPGDSDVASWLADLPGAVPRLARHVLVRIGVGLSFSDAFQQCKDAELGVYSHAFYVLGALVTTAPLLGLLGTVLGMIDTFDAVAGPAGETTTLVADGVSQALITTQVGLVAALPGTFGLAHLYRLYTQLRNDIDRCESHLYLILQKLG